MGLPKGLDKKAAVSTTPVSGGKVEGKAGKKSEKVGLKANNDPEIPGVSAHENNPERKSCKSEIDEIFGNKKRKVLILEQEQAAAEAAAAQGKKKKNKKKAKGAAAILPTPRVLSQSSASSETKPRKKTIDGFKIYSEDEIGFGSKNAGGTKLCPFDCDCCF